MTKLHGLTGACLLAMSLATACLGADEQVDEEVSVEALPEELGLNECWGQAISEYDWNEVLRGTFKDTCDRNRSKYMGGGEYCIDCSDGHGNRKRRRIHTCDQGWNNCNGNVTCSSSC